MLPRSHSITEAPQIPVETQGGPKPWEAPPNLLGLTVITKGDPKKHPKFTLSAPRSHSPPPKKPQIPTRSHNIIQAPPKPQGTPQNPQPTSMTSCLAFLMVFWMSW